MSTLRQGGILSGRALGGVGRGTPAPTGAARPRIPNGFPGNESDYQVFQKYSGMSERVSEAREIQEATTNVIAEMENAIKQLKEAHAKNNLAECQKHLGTLYTLPQQYGGLLEQLLAR